MGLLDFLGGSSEKRIKKIMDLLDEAKEFQREGKKEAALRRLNIAENKYHRYEIGDMKLYRKILDYRESWNQRYTGNNLDIDNNL